MTFSSIAETSSDASDRPRLPWAALLVMALTGFIGIATETMPAGLLPQIAEGLDTTEGRAGQLVSAYALGTILAAIPAIVLTRGVRRKPLLLLGILGFLVANTLTALAPNLAWTLVARLVAGAFSGLLWGMLAGYARRIVPAALAGRALAVAMSGTPVALAAGTPLGSWIGTNSDWRWSFGAMSLLSVIALVLAVAFVPDAPGQGSSRRVSTAKVLRLPGVAAVLAVVFVWMLAHNVQYTYIAPYLSSASVGLDVDVALCVFGLSALAGIWLTGVLIDRNLRRLVLGSIIAFVAAGVVLGIGQHSLAAIVPAIVLWGFAFGGAATQLQTAIGNASGDNGDVANSFLTVSFNLAIFAGGVGGAVAIAADASALPWIMVILAALAFVIVAASRRSAFAPGAIAE